jgi:hypothetical protein
MVDFLKGSACGFAFSKQTPLKANHLPARIGHSGAERGVFASSRRKKKTRPSAQYTANDLASPGH